MPLRKRAPVLIVEGTGDQRAVPELVRVLLTRLEFYDIAPTPRPIKAGTIHKLRRPGELEKFVRHASNRPEGDSILLILDCDDDCPATTAAEFTNRVSLIRPQLDKPVGVALLKREFETLCLFSAIALSENYPEYEWMLDNLDPVFDWEAIRDAKGQLNQLMNRRTYKATTDQVRFAARMDQEVLRARSRSFQHLENTIRWLAGEHCRDISFYPG